MSRPKVVLADGLRLELDGFAAVLAGAFDVIASVADAPAAIEAVERLRPAALVVDYNLPETGGIEVTRAALRIAPELRVLLLSSRAAVPYISQALRAGVSGYLLSSEPSEELIHALKTIVAGREYFSPLIAHKEGQVSAAQRDGHLALGLTARQTELLRFVGEGLSMKEIAQTMQVSPRTVEFHKSSLLRILGVRSARDLSRCAFELGVVAAPPERASGAAATPAHMNPATDAQDC